MKKLVLALILLSHSAWSAEYKGVGEGSVSPEDVKKYAPRPIAKDLSRKIQLMMDIRSPGQGMVTSDGKKLYFTWRVTGITQIWRLDKPDSFPIQMTGGEDRTELADITPDGHKLIMTRDVGGEENPGLYWQNATGGPLNMIQHKAKIQTLFDFVSADSRYLYFHSNDIKENSYAIYRYDFSTGKSEPIFSQDGLWSIADHKGNETFLLAKQVGSLWAEFYEWKVGSKDLTPILGQNEKEEYDVKFSARPGEFLVLTPKMGEFRRLYTYKNLKFTPITPDFGWDVSGFSMDEGKTKIYYSLNEKGYTRARAMDAKTFKPLTLPTFPDADHVYTGAATRNGKFITMGVETAKSPRTSYVYNWQTKQLTRWLVPSAPEADLSGFPRPVLEYYKAADGTSIPMFVRRPKECETKVCPVIVSFHGGPEGQSKPSFSPILEVFLDAGFVFVEPNVRGSDGYGKTWLNSDNGAKRLSVITDIRDAATFIREKWAKDGVAPKIGVYGGSYGGYSSQVAMTMFAGAYDAGVSIVGMSNLTTFLKNTAPYRRLLRTTEYGDPDTDAEALKKLSPITYVSQVKSPMLFIQGLNDPRVPVGEAIQMHETLLKKKISSDLIIFPDEGHGSAKRDNQVKQFGYVLEFFEKNLR
jgi:dipeptidyl aminopeptidase/acylaminoacyl peptidase